MVCILSTSLLEHSNDMSSLQSMVMVCLLSTSLLENGNDLSSLDYSVRAW